MRIAHITPGAGGMFCGSCMHDNTLASALIEQGHDVALIPIYTPIRTDEDSVAIDRIFYGAINVFLEQKTALFRHTPWLVDRMLNSRQLLHWAASRGSTIDARELGELTLSVLRGEEGNQRKELDRLVEWLRDDYRPDLVHLSNSMLVGMARRLKQELAVPVLCSVQGEDIFLEELHEPHRSEVLELLKERSRDVDGLVAMSRYYIDAMARYLDVPREKTHHVPLGLRLDGFRSDEPAADRPFTIGYLARICPEKGLHVLVDAFRRLVGRAGCESARLVVAGFLGPRDQAYFNGVTDQLRSWGLDDRFRYLGEIDRAQKIDYLASLDVLSVPTIYREPKGLFVIEALASGVPVVEPNHGAFPELLEATGGGVLFEPESAEGLADALAGLMDDPERRRELGRRGRDAVRSKYDHVTMARKTLDVYRYHVAAAKE